MAKKAAPLKLEPDVDYRAVFTYRGKQYRPGDLRAREIEEIERVTKIKYIGHDPVDLTTGSISDMTHAIAYMAAMLKRDYTVEEIEAFIIDTPVAALDAMWSLEADDLPYLFTDGLPEAVGGPSTSTSSGSPAPRTAGRRK